MPEVEVNGVRLHYMAAGKGEAVVLIHGFTSSHVMWYNQVPALARAGFRSYAYDARGHGDSQKPGKGYDADSLALELGAFMDALNVPRAHVAGLSMGGMIAQRFALSSPERVATLTIADSFTGGPVNGVMRSFQDQMDLLMKKGLPGLWASMLSNPAFPVGPDFTGHLELMDLFQKNFMKNDPDSLALFVQEFAAARDWTGDLASISRPTLLIVGEYDAPCLDPMRRMSENIPGSELVVIPRCGHVSALEKPEEFNRAFLPFLKQHPIG